MALLSSLSSKYCLLLRGEHSKTQPEKTRKFKQRKLENSIELMKHCNCFDRNQYDLIAQYNSENVVQY